MTRTRIVDWLFLASRADNFSGQEPGTDSDIKQFCTLTYGVGYFYMFSKISVKGKDQAPLYQALHFFKVESAICRIGWMEFSEISH